MSIYVNKLVIKNQQDGRYLVKELSFSVSKNDKLAIIGDEGSGKTTLLKVLHGTSSLNHLAVSGEVIKHGRSGYLEQNIKKTWGHVKTIDYLLLSHPDGVIDHLEYNKLKHLSKYLNEVGFDLKVYDDDKLISQYAGGEVIRLGLVKIFLDDVDIILLDEPSNDLDFVGLTFLTEFINTTTRPIMFISHDQYLLEATANKIIHLFVNKKSGDVISSYEEMSYGDYQRYRLQKRQKDTMIGQKQQEQYLTKQEKWHQIYQNVKYQQDQAVRNPGLGKALKKKMHSVISLKKRMDKTKEQFVEIPPKDEFIDMFFPVSCELASNKIVLDLELDYLCNAFSPPLSLVVLGRERVVITGNNGVGKTTLLKIIVDNLQKRQDLKVGYMPQCYEEVIDPKINAVTFLVPENNKMIEGQIRKMLGSALFTKDEMLIPLSKLSGGSIAKLFLLKMIVDCCNVLVLDEPTRNISPINAPEVYRLLREYRGTIICVSHDRYFIEQIATKVYTLTKNGLILN